VDSLTEPELIWHLAKDADWLRVEVYRSVVDYMGVDAFAADEWDKAWEHMQAYWMGEGKQHSWMVPNDD
jgi:hypothetical protein